MSENDTRLGIDRACSCEQLTEIYRQYDGTDDSGCERRDSAKVNRVRSPARVSSLIGRLIPYDISRCVLDSVMTADISKICDGCSVSAFNKQNQPKFLRLEYRENKLTMRAAVLHVIEEADRCQIRIPARSLLRNQLIEPADLEVLLIDRGTRLSSKIRCIW